MKSADWCCFSVKTAIWCFMILLFLFGRCGHDVLKDSQMSLGRSPRTNMDPLKTPHFLCAETFDRLCQYWKFRSSGSRSIFHSRHIHIQKKQYIIYTKCRSQQVLEVPPRHSKRSCPETLHRTATSHSCRRNLAETSRQLGYCWLGNCLLGQGIVGVT